MEKRVVILHTQSGDWEGLFIDGKLIDEGHHLGNGDVTFLLKQAEIYKFEASDIIISEVNDTDEELMDNCGNFPPMLDGLSGTYNKK